jgi:hypothetical protein
MKKYSADNWRKLGRRVNLARIKAGYSDTQEWADAVGRSSRMLLGLERGEPVGSGTIDRVAITLGWNPEEPYDVLDGVEVPTWGRGGGEAVTSVGGADQDEPEFEFLTRVREDLTTDEMEQLMKEATPYLEMLVRDIKNRHREQS